MSRLRSPILACAFALCALVTASAGCATDAGPGAAESPTTTVVAFVDPSSSTSPAANTPLTPTTLPVASGQEPATTTATTIAGTVAVADPSTTEKFPLDATFGLDINPQPDPLAQSEVERLTAECMLAEGWKYTPTVTKAAGDPTEASAAYGEMYGYGIVHTYQALSAALSAAEQAPADANKRYVESLTEAEKQQYYNALSGDQSAGFDPTKGCSNIAETTVNGLSPLQKSDDFAARVESWLQTFEQNPALSTAIADRKACMLQHFPTIDRYNSSAEYVQELFNTAYDGSGGQIPADQLAVLAMTELEVWRTERDCAESSGYNDVRRQLEAEFVTELLAEFPELALQPG
jgi:hypothetical protein